LIELPVRDPCDICEGMASRANTSTIIDESANTVTVLNPQQWEIGPCCVVTRRHVATLLDLSDDECGEIIGSAKRVAHALVKSYQPLGILTFQNNGVYSGQETPHYHFHVVPRQIGSDWGIGPPQLAYFESAGRIKGTSHDASNDDERRKRVEPDAATLKKAGKLIRSNLPDRSSQNFEVRL
jgi:histidine triad (HIT) family protein